MAQIDIRNDAVQGMGEGQDEGAQYQGAKIKPGKENLGKVVQISGPAVDVQFDEKTMPGDLSGAARGERGLHRSVADQRDP